MFIYFCLMRYIFVGATKHCLLNQAQYIHQPNVCSACPVGAWLHCIIAHEC
jgi:hypothetical protein